MSHINRRHFLGATAAASAAAVGGFGRLAEAAGVSLTPGVPEGVASYATMGTLPGKKPLIQLSDRPPNYEAPIEYLRTPITPNDQFYVRYHLADIPNIKAEGYKIAVGGDGANGRAEVTLDDLKKMPAVEVVAVNQCSGNRRGLSKPHVQGVEWGYGAMGCARWKGARLKDVLDKAGLKKEAIEIVFNGADGPAVDKTPDFIKSIPVWKAIDEFDNRRLRDERRTSAAFQRIPGAHHRAWLDRHLLDEARHRDQRADQARIKLLDESGLPHSSREIPGQGSLYQPGKRGKHPDHRNGGQFADHQPPQRRQSESRQGHSQRHGLGRRLWHPHGANLDRWRQDLGLGNFGPGSRPLRVPAVELRVRGQERQQHGDGQRHQQARPESRYPN